MVRVKLIGSQNHDAGGQLKGALLEEALNDLVVVELNALYFLHSVRLNVGDGESAKANLGLVIPNLEDLILSTEE